MKNLEKFTLQAQRVVISAQEEARTLNHNYVGTEHLLLSLVRESEGAAAKMLESLGISLETVRQQVEEIIGYGRHPPSGRISFTPEANKTLKLALRETKHLDDGLIDTEHLLLGLIREGNGVAAQVLLLLGADLDHARQQLIQLRLGQLRRVATRTAKRTRARTTDDTPAPGTVENRLGAIERWVGMRPGLEDLGREITYVRGEKESAIHSQDFESAAALRDREKELLATKTSREQEWAATAADRLPLAEEVARINSDLERLRTILHEHGIELKDNTASRPDPP